MIVGLQLFDGDADAMRRQRQAVEALSALRGVQAVNLQFRTGAQTRVPGVETLAVLDQDSRTITGADVRRKPVTREVFDVLARVAEARGFDAFSFINADILVRHQALAQVRAMGRQTYAISRADVADASRPEGPALLTAGQDMFVLSTEWWRANAWRFRPYIIGEMGWDVVYTAIMLCHSDGLLLNREPLILHERHAPGWHAPTPAARYNGMLAALDARYFSIWCRYWERLEAARRQGASAEEEQRLRREEFVWRPSTIQAAKQVFRTLKAHAVYRRQQRTWHATTEASA